MAREAAGLRWLQSLYALTEWNNAAVWAHIQHVLHPWRKQLSFSYKVNDLDIWCPIGVRSRQRRFYRAGLLKWWLKSCGIYLVVSMPRNAELFVFFLNQWSSRLVVSIKGFCLILAKIESLTSLLLQKSVSLVTFGSYTSKCCWLLLMFVF